MNCESLSLVTVCTELTVKTSYLCTRAKKSERPSARKPRTSPRTKPRTRTPAKPPTRTPAILARILARIHPHAPLQFLPHAPLRLARCPLLAPSWGRCCCWRGCWGLPFFRPFVPYGAVWVCVVGVVLAWLRCGFVVSPLSPPWAKARPPPPLRCPGGLVVHIKKG